MGKNKGLLFRMEAQITNNEENKKNKSIFN
jgi:hypothetical protein